MYNLKFFSANQPDAGIPSYRAMACTSYEISPPMLRRESYDHYADVVMHLSNGDVVQWPLKGNQYLIVENAGGSTIDKIRNPAGPQPTDPDAGMPAPLMSWREAAAIEGFEVRESTRVAQPRYPVPDHG